MVTASDNDARRVLDALVRDTKAHFADEVLIRAAWIESPEAICVVYERTIDDGLVLGRRIRFPPHARPDDPESTGEDYAEVLREPAATLWGSQRDNNGVIWLGVGKDPLPKDPASD